MNEHLYEAPNSRLKTAPPPVVKPGQQPLNNHMSFKFSDYRSGTPPHLDKMSPEERKDIEQELALIEQDRKREKFTGHNWLFHSWVNSNDIE